jgi:hypothetical protein
MGEYARSGSGPGCLAYRILERAVWLKRLVEATMPHAHPKDEVMVMQLLKTFLERIVTARILDRGRRLEELQTSYDILIEDLFLTDWQDTASMLQGCLFLTYMRLTSQYVDERGQQGVMIALFEGRAYEKARQHREVMDCYGWVRTRLEQIEASLTPQERIDVGAGLLHSACITKLTPHKDDALDLLFDALRFLPDDGDDRARALLTIGELQQRERRLKQAHAALLKAKKVKDVKDKRTLALIDSKLGELEADITGQPERLVLPDELAETLGGPTGMTEIMWNVSRKLKEGIPLSDEELAEVATKCVEAARYGHSVGANRDGIVRQHLLAVKLVLGIKEPARKPFQEHNHLRQIERLLELASDGVREEYASVKRMVDSVNLMPPKPEPKMRTLADLRAKIQQAQSAATKPEQQQPRPSVADPDERPQEGDPRRFEIPTLSQQLLEQVFRVLHGDPPRIETRLLQTMERLAQLGEEAVELAVTPESLMLVRDEFDTISRCAALLVMKEHGIVDQLVEPFAKDALDQKGPFERHLIRRELDDDEWSKLAALYALLQSASRWVGSGYQGRPLWKALHEVDNRTRAEFAERAHELAEQLQRIPDDPFFREDVANQKGPVVELGKTISLARALIMCNKPRSARDDLKPARDIGSIPAGSAVSFLVNLLPSTHDSGQSLLALLTFEADSVRCWCSAERTFDWLGIAEMMRGLLPDRMSDFADKLIDLQRSKNHALTDLLDACPSIRELAVVDLTAKNIPLAVTDDPESRLPVAMSNSPAVENCVSRPLRISFWGAMQLQAEDPLVVDETGRCVRMTGGGGESAISYPSLPDGLGTKSTFGPAALPYSHFERWTLQDLTVRGLCELGAYSGSTATRAAFLETDWAEVDVLHISTHGEAYPGVIEAANLQLSADGRRSTRVHFLDVLSRDWSSAQLVFLNACMTKHGQQWTGDEDLSLAWAFHAAGASAVIASRWYVQDAAAWFFARQFYDAWLDPNQRLTVREAFHLALQATRRQPQFGNAAIWGAFVLID